MTNSAFDRNGGTSARKWIRVFFLLGGVFLVGILLVAFFIFRPVRFVGSSGLPAVKDGDLMWLIPTGAIRRGDLVVFTSDQRYSGALYIKRVIGVPGDQLRMVRGAVFINKRPLDESYIINYWKQKNNFDDCSYLANSSFWTFRSSTARGSPCDGPEEAGEDLILKADEYFVIGDNRSPGGSEDSRSLGPIKQNAIERRVLAVGFPPVAVERPKVFDVFDQSR